MVRLQLPYPPSVNRYYRHIGGRTLISRDGRAYRRCVQELLAPRSISPLDGPLSVFVDLFPPDRRRRDADNAMKAICDSLEHAGIYHDDSQIVHLEVHKLEPVSGGRSDVEILPLNTFRSERNRRSGTHEIVCCARCGRDTFRHIRDRADAYCDRCLIPGKSHALPEDLDRDPLGEPLWFGGHAKHDLEFGHDDVEDE